MFFQEGKKVLAILDGALADPDQGDFVLFDIESDTFKFELKTLNARGQYIEVGWHALSNGVLGPGRCILDGGKVKQLYDAFEEFKKTTLPDFDPPSPSIDEDFESPSDLEN